MAAPVVHSIRILNPWFLEQDHTGVPAAGYRVYTLVAGSVNTLLTTYSDYNLTAPNTNPVVLNIYGEALIFTDQQYIKLVYTSPTGDLTSPIWTQDYVATVPYRDTNSIGVASGTANNIYVVDTIPSYTNIPDGFSLVMIPDISNLDTFISQSFTGAGINDAVFAGPYTGSTSSVFQVQIDSTPGAPTADTFKWRKDSGSWTTVVSITGSAQILEEGITITFSELLGHTLNDLWTLTVRPATYLNFCGLGASIIYKNLGGTLTVLSGGDIIAGIPAHLDWSAGQSCWILINPSLPVLSSLARKIYRREVTATGDIVMSDAGNEVAYTGIADATLTLPSCAVAADYVFDITNYTANTVTVEVAGGTDLIVFPESLTGETEIILSQATRTGARLVTNGADWHLLAETKVNHGMVAFTTVGTFTWICPAGTTFLSLSGCGGGGGGSVGANGGGKAVSYANYPLTVVPGTSYTITIGAGGASATSGDATTFDVLLTLAGGTTGGSSTTDGEDSLYGTGGLYAGGDATGYGAGGGANDPGNTGGSGSDGFLILEW